MSLELFFKPRSVGVIGASRSPGKVGYEITRNLIAGGFEGPIHPINPNADEIEGLPCVDSLAEIDPAPDMVLIVLPAPYVPEAMQQCAKAGVKAVCIITAGFKEVGEDGAMLEAQIVDIARRNKIRVLGPNCLGLIVPTSKLNASFGSDLPQPGRIGYVSQSGALLTAILDRAETAGIGFSKLVSIGNKADIDELDMIAALGRDPDTTVIAGYLESIGQGDQFVREVEQISNNKPIILLKAGGTEAGARAASSHTGSMVGSESVYDSAFTRAGVMRVTSLAAQFDLAQAFAYQPLPAGDRVAVITNAGGAGILAADSIERGGLSFAKLTEDGEAKLKANLPPAANIHNPIDVLGDALADRYEFALDTALADENVDVALVLLTPQAMTECDATAEAIVRVAKEHPNKPVMAAFMGAAKVEQSHHILREGSVPAFDGPDSAVRAIRAMVDYVRFRNRPKRVVKLFPVNRHRVERIIDRNLRRGEREIGEMESKEILEAYGFVTPKGSIATTAEQAGNIADQIGYPIVMKIWSPDILHKSDVGGVKVGLNSRQQVMDAFDLMMYRIPMKQPEAQILGVLVQEMVRSGQEVILGMNRDPQFGPLMMFGMGGIFVEVLKDVSFYLAPLTAEEARQMLAGTRTYHLLKGVRGQEGVDVDAIAEALQRLSQLVTEFPQIQEMDINPFVVGPPGSTPVAVDVRMSVEKVRGR
jgi:acetyl coenzyme A synthetase (ADP forming)-like protein